VRVAIGNSSPPRAIPGNSTTSAGTASEQENLAAQRPDRVKALEQVWQRQADGFAELAKLTLTGQPLPTTLRPIASLNSQP